MKIISKFISKKIKTLVMFICWLVPIQKKKIVFSSYRGRQYSDNPMYISKILETSNVKDLDIVWLLKENVPAPKNVRTVIEGSIKSAYELATAKVWVDNCRKEEWIIKRKGQFYIQTWHGNIAGKKVEADAKSLSDRYIRCAKHDSAISDYFLSGSKWASDNYRSSFWYDGRILEIGNPRSDIFYLDSSDIIKKVRKYYSLKNNTRIAIYAPTFRLNHDVSVYDLDYSNVLQNLEKRWGGDWVLIVRLHPNIAYRKDIINYTSQILDGSSYQDINELIVSCDLLITDYSSCMFDAMEAHKRVLLYASDIEEYENERGHYFSINELPFTLSCNNEQFFESISNFDQEEYEKKINEFIKLCGICNDGHASQRASDLILEIVKTR